jgi:ornithine cyclodeaminase/alanine dehydrogenase-like protein (mu-crystallin family)
MPIATKRQLCDGGDDTHFATAARTGADVDREHPTQALLGSMETQSSCEKALHPAHRVAELENVVAGLRCGRSSGDDVVTMFRHSGQTGRDSEPGGCAGEAPGRQGGR